jgi:DNA-binding HxlR family transcriptional regulator/putative sterol carrier protein
MRSYQQFCPAARALDVVGERWTLLVVRELLTGPKRYTDLQDGLPGIGPNVLAQRLRSLESAALVQKRRLPPPAASTVYELTELGSGLDSVMTSLFQWGLQLAGAPTRGDAVRASYWLPAIQQAVRPGALPKDVDDTYEFRVGDERIVVTASGGEVEVTPGEAEEPDLVITTDHETLAGLGRGAITPLQAIEEGRLSVEGDPAAAERCAELFGAAASADAGT